jgi:predicted dehydrogenase
VRVGIAGIGFMGWIHWLAWHQVPGAEVAAICTRNRARRSGDWTGIQGNFGPPGEQVDLQGVAAYADLEMLLGDDSIDLVDVCLPPGLHASAAVAALDAGRDVLCEKPMALRSGLCDAMVAASERSGRRLLVAHVLPFFPEYAFARQTIAAGTYGPLLGGDFRRTVADPKWVEGFYSPDAVGGPLLDLLVHDFHFVRSVIGMPLSVSAVGRTREGLVEYASMLLRFPDPAVYICCNGGVINQQGRPFTHGFELHFAQATLQFEFASFGEQAELMPLKILTEDGQVLRVEPDNADPVQAFVSELTEVTKVLSGDVEGPTVLDGLLARDAIRICEAVAESVQRGGPVVLAGPVVAG